MADWKVRRERDQFAKFGDRRCGIRVHQRGAKILPCVEALGIAALDFAILTDGCDVITFAGVGVTEVVLCIQIARVQGERLFELRGCSSEILQAVQQNAQASICEVVVRLAADRFLKFQFGSIEILHIAQGDACAPVSDGVIGILLQGGLGFAEGLFGMAALGVGEAETLVEFRKIGIAV